MDERKYVDAFTQDLAQRKRDFERKVADVYVLPPSTPCRIYY